MVDRLTDLSIIAADKVAEETLRLMKENKLNPDDQMHRMLVAKSLEQRFAPSDVLSLEQEPKFDDIENFKEFYFAECNRVKENLISIFEQYRDNFADSAYLNDAKESFVRIMQIEMSRSRMIISYSGCLNNNNYVPGSPERLCIHSFNKLKICKPFFGKYNLKSSAFNHTFNEPMGNYWSFSDFDKFVIGAYSNYFEGKEKLENVEMFCDSFKELRYSPQKASKIMISYQAEVEEKREKDSLEKERQRIEYEKRKKDLMLGLLNK